MHNPGQRIRLRSSARTDTGRVRDNNEDHIYLWAQHEHVVLATVADGMGGAVAGEEASRIAVEAIQSGLIDGNINEPEFFTSMDQDDLIENLKSVIRIGNNHIIDQASAHPELKGMGTTVTMAFIRNNHAIIGHVGDSRAYLIDGQDGHIMQVTADHSFVQALVAAGHITEEEAEEHPMKNVLYRALGQARDLEIDVYYEHLHAGDRLILCSDGLTLHIKPHEIAEISLKHNNPEDASQSMVDLANKRGGRDNISVIVIKAEAIEESGNHQAITTDMVYQDQEEYDDEETLMAPQGFGPSESTNSPSVEQRDGAPQQRREPPGTLSTTTQTMQVVKVSDHSDKKDENGTPDSTDTLGEGHDIYTPDQ